MQTENDTLAAETRLRSLPEAVRLASYHDAHLRSLVMHWAATGQVPADMPTPMPWRWSDVSAGRPDAPPPRMVDADVPAALAFFVVGMVVSKAACMAAWGSYLREHGVSR